MTFEKFALLLAERTQFPIHFDEVRRLAADRFADIGEIPTIGDPNAGINLLVNALKSVRDAFNFGRIVLYAGYLAEHGAVNPEVGRLVAEQISKFVSLAALAAESADYQDIMKLAVDVSKSNLDAASAILIADAALTGAMALFCRERDALRIAQKDVQLLHNVRAISDRVKTANFFAELLESSDEEKIIVIQPSSLKGFQVVADNVRNGFQFFTLLEGALIVDYEEPYLKGPAVSPKELAIARGELQPEGECVIQARFDYFNWSAWGETGIVSDAPTRWIWGELPIKYIPKVYGCPIVLLEQPLYVRTWDARLSCGIHQAIKSKVEVVQVLEKSGVVQWLDIFASAPLEARNQMKYAGVKM